MRQVLVVERLREPKFQLPDPQVEWILSRVQRLAHPLDQQVLKGVVVEVRDRERDLG